MPGRVNFPGYAERMAARYALVNAEELSNEKFAVAHGLTGVQLGRWLKTLPDSFERCERWAAILGVPTTWLFVRESDLAPLAAWFKDGQPILPPLKQRGAPIASAQRGAASCWGQEKAGLLICYPIARVLMLRRRNRGRENT